MFINVGYVYWVRLYVVSLSFINKGANMATIIFFSTSKFEVAEDKIQIHSINP